MCHIISTLCHFPFYVISSFFIIFTIYIIPHSMLPFQFMYSFRDSRVSYRPCSFLCPLSFYYSRSFYIIPKIFRHSLSSCPSFIPSILLRHSRNSYIILGILTSFLQFLHHSWNSYIIPATFTSFPQLSSSFPQLSSSFPRRRESSTLVYFIAFYHFLIKKCAK